MARINTYQVDNDIGANDIIIGSEYNGVTSSGIPIYKTKNYRLSDLQLFFGGGNFESAAPITIETLPAGNKKWVHDNITRTSSTSSVTLVHKGTFTAMNSITSDNKGHITATTLATYTLPDYQFNIAADSNPGSDNAVIDINGSNFETLTVLGGVVLTSEITADDTITIDHDDVTRSDSSTLTPSTLTYGTADTGKFTAVTTVSTTGQGHVTNVQSTQFTLPEIYSFNVRGDNTDATQAITDNNTLIIAGTAPISTLSSATDTVTISHDNITRSTETNTASSAPAFGGTFAALDSVSSNAQGHVTASNKTTVTIPNTVFTGPSGNPVDTSGARGLVPGPGTADGLKFLRGDSTWATIPETYNFFIAANSDTDPVSNKEIVDGETLSILGGTYLTSQVSGDNVITINHDAGGTLTETNITSITNTAFGGTFTVMGSVGRDTQGHLNSARPVTVTVPGNLFSSSSLQNGSQVGGSIGLVPKPSSTDGGKFLRADASWATLPVNYSFSINADATVTNDPVFNKQITSGQTLNILGGTNLGSTVGADDTVTINHNTFNTTTSTHGDSGDAIGFGGNVTVLSGLTPSNGHITNIESIQINIPSLPTYDGDDIDIDTGALTGAAIVSDIDFNVTTNTLGHVTDANGTVSTRNLTLADLSYTGALDANKYVLPTDLDGDDIDIDTTALTGATIISDLDINITTDTSGRVTDANGSVSTRALTLANLGYTGDTDAKNHQTAAELRTAIGTGNNNLVPAQGTSGHFLNHLGAFSLPPDTNTNTTYSAGTGITLSGTSFSLTQTTNTANAYYRIPFMNSNVINIDNTTSHFSFNPSTNGLTVGTIGVGVTPFANTLSSSTNIDLIGNGGILSYASNLYLTSNAYYNSGWKAKTTGTTSLLIVKSSALEYHVDTSSQSAGAATAFSKVFFVTSGGIVEANNFRISSDKRLKSEIEPIKEGLEVIKKFTSYNYIKGGEKESGFIAQEVKKVIPHTVYENKEGYLSMSDRGVLAHMHKAILELEKRLISIEEKLK